VFVIASFLTGWLVAVAFRASPRDRFTLAAEFATRNVAVAVTLGITVLRRTELVTFATTYGLVEVPLLLLSALAFRLRVSPPASPR
jgi:ACR3 family arsenite efflux pump ArsB